MDKKAKGTAKNAPLTLFSGKAGVKLESSTVPAEMLMLLIRAHTVCPTFKSRSLFAFNGHSGKQGESHIQTYIHQDIIDDFQPLDAPL